VPPWIHPRRLEGRGLGRKLWTARVRDADQQPLIVAFDFFRARRRARIALQPAPAAFLHKICTRASTTKEVWMQTTRRGAIFDALKPASRRRVKNATANTARSTNVAPFAAHGRSGRRQISRRRSFGAKLLAPCDLTVCLIRWRGRSTTTQELRKMESLNDRARLSPTTSCTRATAVSGAKCMSPRLRRKNFSRIIASKRQHECDSDS